MRYIFVGLFLLLPTFLSKAQIRTETSFPDIRNKKGDLIAINEMHGALANTQVYLDILKHVHEQLPDDTINLLLEIPFSQAVWCNDFLASGGKIAMSERVYPSPEFWNEIVLQQIPVKIFGCDFEYDAQFKRNKSLIYLLQKTSDDLVDAKMDTGFIASYIAMVKGFQLQEKNTRALIKQLEAIQPAATSVLKMKIGQLIFALEAPQKYSSGRDAFIYRRSLDGIKQHNFDYQNQINILIHGVAHINPVNKKSLFNRFRNGGDSPFRGKCFVLGNVYLNCKNNSGIFRHETINSYSFYAIEKDGTPITTYFNALQLSSQEVHFLATPKAIDLGFPGLTQEEILGLYVHVAIVN